MARGYEQARKIGTRRHVGRLAGNTHTLPQIPEEEEVAHVSKDVHPRVHPGPAQPMAAHGEDTPYGVADAARGITRQEPVSKARWLGLRPAGSPEPLSAKPCPRVPQVPASLG